MIINRKEMAGKKLDKLKNGYSAFTDSIEIAGILKREIETHNLDIHIDETTMGYWFIPK